MANRKMPSRGSRAKLTDTQRLDSALRESGMTPEALRAAAQAVIGAQGLATAVAYHYASEDAAIQFLVALDRIACFRCEPRSCRPLGINLV